MQELARRTVGIFSYPTSIQSMDQVVKHARDFGSQFGQIMYCCAKWGADGKLYAILNYDGPAAARAAVASDAVPEINGWYMNIKPWRVPGEGAFIG